MHIVTKLYPKLFYITGYYLLHYYYKLYNYYYKYVVLLR